MNEVFSMLPVILVCSGEKIIGAPKFCIICSYKESVIKIKQG